MNTVEKTVRNEIGSFYEEEALYKTWFLNGMEKKGRESAFSWINRCAIGKEIYYFQSGRSALSAIATDVEKKNARKTVLMPSYLCETMITPFTCRGWKIVFYHVNELLYPNQIEIEELISKYNPGMILIIPYYGLNTVGNEIRKEIYRLCEGKKLLVCEDLTQSLALLESVFHEKTQPDYVIASLRKWFPIPEGGLCIANQRMHFDYACIKNLFYSKQRKAQQLKKCYLNGVGEVELKEEFLCLHRDAEKELAEVNEIYGILPDTINDLNVCDIQSIFAKRHENALFLEMHLEDNNEIKKVFKMTPWNWSPIYYPIYTLKREELQEFLKGCNIFSPVLWPLPEDLSKDRLTEAERQVYENMLCLPCDHRYSVMHMQQIIDSLHRYEKRQEEGDRL